MSDTNIELGTFRMRCPNPNCNKTLEVRKKSVGKTKKCPTCNQDFIVPSIPQPDSRPRSDFAPKPDPVPRSDFVPKPDSIPRSDFVPKSDPVSRSDFAPKPHPALQSQPASEDNYLETMLRLALGISCFFSVVGLFIWFTLTLITAPAAITFLVLILKRRNRKIEDELIKQAKQGDKQAQYDLACWYQRRKNRTEAIHWFQQAIRKGHEDAWCKLEQIHKEGSGAKKQKTTDKRNKPGLQPKRGDGAHEAAKPVLSWLFDFSFRDLRLELSNLWFWRVVYGIGAIVITLCSIVCCGLCIYFAFAPVQDTQGFSLLLLLLLPVLCLVFFLWLSSFRFFCELMIFMFHEIIECVRLLGAARMYIDHKNREQANTILDTNEEAQHVVRTRKFRYL